MRGFLLAIVAGLGLFQSQVGQAAGWSEGLLVKSLQESQVRQLTYLPAYLLQRKTDCEIYRDEDRASCLAQLLEHAQSVLACPQSRQRWEEGIAHDAILAKESFLVNPPAAIPPEVKAVFERLVTAARRWGLAPRFPVKLQLAAYQSKIKNAHATVGGQMYASAGLWSGEEALTLPEVAAILAHEITHVLEFHGMDLNCIAVEWTDSRFDVHMAATTFQEDFRGSVRFDAWSALSQRLEYRADIGAVKLLKLAGFDPRMMGRALERIRPKTSGGFSSGSHPDFDARLAAAYGEAEK